MISIKTNGITYSNIFENIEWSGSIKTSCRTLEVTYLKDKANFELGQEIEFIVDKRKIFIGKIFRISQNTNEETYSFKAYDNAIMLNKNSFIENFYNIPPSNIVKNILGKLKIEIGKLPLDAIYINRVTTNIKLKDIFNKKISLQNLETIKRKENIIIANQKRCKN